MAKQSADGGEGQVDFKGKSGQHEIDIAGRNPRPLPA